MKWPFKRKAEQRNVNLLPDVEEARGVTKSPVIASEFDCDPGLGAIDQTQIKVLFVCTGNICRSASGAIIAKAARNAGLSNWRVESAGTGAVVGHGVDVDIATALRELKVEAIDDHVAKQLNYHLLEAADLIIVFDESHFRWIIDEAPQVMEKIFPLGKLTAMLEKGPRTVNEIKQVNLKVATRPIHWIEDPYRRGLDAARSCVTEIKRDLDIVIANLK